MKRTNEEMMCIWCEKNKPCYHHGRQREHKAIYGGLNSHQQMALFVDRVNAAFGTDRKYPKHIQYLKSL